jgi:hypothetical protein
MRKAWLIVLTAMLAAAGCVSQKKANMEARAAFISGEQQAMQARIHAQQAQGPVVFLQGPIQNPIVQWRENMTLSEAIVAANYTAFMNPRLVRVLRGTQVVGELKGIDLLHHQDMSVEPGDTIIIVP